MKGEIEESQLSIASSTRQAQHRLLDAANSIRFLTRFGMTLNVRLLHSVRNDREGGTLQQATGNSSVKNILRFNTQQARHMPDLCGCR